MRTINSDTTTAEVPDVYFASGYGRAAMTASDACQWISVQCFEARWQIPLLLTRIRDDLYDAASPYGYAGVYAHDSLSPVEELMAWDAFGEWARSQGVVSLFLRRSPLVRQSAAPGPVVPVVSTHPTIFLSIGDIDETWKQFEGRCRTAVRKAQKSGVRVETRIAKPADLVLSAPFRTLYNETMLRRSAASHYLFDDAYYEALIEALGERLMISIARDESDDVVASALFMGHEKLLHYHLSGSSVRGSALGASNWMIWEACRHGAHAGYENLHLGGGIAPGDSLHRFKRSFGGVKRDYRAEGVIMDSRMYKQLAEENSRRVGERTYFPAYREP